MDGRSLLLLVSGILAVTLVAVALMLTQQNCREGGGQFVRGLFWFQCIEPR